jgi:hypothetical protein
MERLGSGERGMEMICLRRGECGADRFFLARTDTPSARCSSVSCSATPSMRSQRGCTACSVSRRIWIRTARTRGCGSLAA